MPEYLLKEPQETVNERLNFLIKSLNTSARDFSTMLCLPDSNSRNYLSKGTKVNADYLERIAMTFKNVSLNWLIAGEGEPFIEEVPTVPVNINNRKNKGPVQNNTGSHATITNNVKLKDCQRDLEASKKEAAAYQREIALLQGQLKDKEEIITLLRATYNRPN
jgi:hypothetical protein